LRFLSVLADYNQQLLMQHKPPAQQQENSLKEALKNIYRIARPGSTIYLISDFSDLNAHCLQYIQQLSLHSDLICFHIYDQLEAELPRPGTYSITNGTELDTIDTYSPQVRKKYHDGFVTKLHELHAELNALKVPLVSICTAQVVLEQLETWNQKTH
jgi:hypothetical protein